MSEFRLSPHDNRKCWLDAIKGFAIILVIMSHTQGFPYIHGYLNACFIQIFFIASGYVYTQKPGSLQKKWKQLLSPYLAWGLFYLCWAVINADEFHLHQIGAGLGGLAYSRFKFSADPLAPVTHLFPRGTAPMWFLTSMALSYCVFLPLVRTSGRKLVLLILSYLGISAALIYCPILLPWSMDTVFVTALLLYTGYRFKDIRLSDKLYLPILLISGVLYIILYRLNGGSNISIRIYGEQEILSVFLFILIGILGTISYSTFFMLMEKSWICRFFAYFGKISLTILCAHMFFAYNFTSLCGLFVKDPNEIPKFITFPTRLAFILLMCILTHHLIQYAGKCLARIRPGA